MTPDKEASMRSELADYSKTEFIDLAVSLQEVCDTHITKQRGMQMSIDAMTAQISPMRVELEKYENGGAVDSDEVEALNLAIETLKDRITTLTTLNEGLQLKLIG